MSVWDQKMCVKQKPGGKRTQKNTRECLLPQIPAPGEKKMRGISFVCLFHFTRATNHSSRVRRQAICVREYTKTVCDDFIFCHLNPIMFPQILCVCLPSRTQLEVKLFVLVVNPSW